MPSLYEAAGHRSLYDDGIGTNLTGNFLIAMVVAPHRVAPANASPSSLHSPPLPGKPDTASAFSIACSFSLCNGRQG